VTTPVVRPHASVVLNPTEEVQPAVLAYSHGFEGDTTNHPAETVLTQGFEGGLGGFSGGFSRVTTAPRTGTYHLSRTTTNTASTSLYTASGLTVGLSYTFAIWARVASGTAAFGLNLAAGSTRAFTLTSSWQQISVTFTASATSQTFYISYVAATIYLDDATLVRDAYSETSPDLTGWSLQSGDTPLEASTTYKRNGNYSLKVAGGGSVQDVAVRTVTGLEVGRDYTLVGYVTSATNTTGTVTIGIEGDSFAASAGGTGGVFEKLEYTFTATATTHTIRLTTSTTHADAFWDDITLTRDAYTKLVGDDVPVTEGAVTLDAMNVPYGTAELTIPLADVELVEQIDPREGQRVTLTAGDEVAGTSRTFNLGLRSREVDHRMKVIRVSLATDEAILQEYAPLADIDLWDYRTSLRSVVNQVLNTCIPGASLEASPSPDADVTPRWEQENLILNPRGTVDAAGWAATGTGGATVTVGTIGTTIVREGADAQSALRLTFTTAATGSPALRYGDATTPKVTPGRLYTFSAFVRQTAGVAKTGRIILRWVSEAGTTIKDATVDASLTDSAWVKMSVTGLAPAGAARAYLYAGILNGMPASSDLRVTAAVFAEGTKNDVWFDGNRADDAVYTYDWTPGALTTPSIRVPVGGEIDPDSLLWPAGTTAWEFLEPLTAGAGLRLFCDEHRKWRLIDPDAYITPGAVSLSPGLSTEGTDTINRDDPETFCTGVRVVYRWRDSQGVDRSRADVAGVPGIVLNIELERPFPGAGVAAAVLARRTGQGRVQEVTALAKWDVNPAQQARVTLPGTLDQQGEVEAVEWGLSNGLMVVKTRALTDVVPGSINALEGTINSLTGTINDL